MLAIETHTAEPIAAGELRLVPIARSARLELGRVSLTWNRAVGLTAESAGGETTVPIRDLTRRLQLAILGAGLLGSLLLRRRRRSRRGTE